ncbi:hypothetical protein P7K49_002231 [Saguinus oedipus]|uniref:Uncharacterized protein n=1 Tax=Saguinus oedipus TaxID=9490 RepID=A0ABQ9WGS5_SAGOE|nr:hypothetical protein P7K49_002231 [Saguinus oedipus]
MSVSLLPLAKGSADLRWFPRVFRGYAERKRRKRENDSANFRKHLRMVGSRRVKAQSKITRGGGWGQQCAWRVGALRAATCAENDPRP